MTFYCVGVAATGRKIAGASRGWEDHRNSGFLKAGSTKAAIQQHWQGMPSTPGKEQEVVGVEVIPAASCHA